MGRIYLSRVTDLTGQVFGRLVVSSFVGKDKRRNAAWECVCECGNTVVVLGYSLKRGATQSCGCLCKEVASEVNTTHGMTGTTQYWAWQSAKDRTTNPNHPEWRHYGGRGIKMCDEWEGSAEAFLRDMGASWEEGLTLERKDVNGNYCPENCVWDTVSVQGHNKRKRSGCSSQYMGVYFSKSANKFVAQIKINSKLIYLGCFSDELEAAVTYDNASEELYKDRPNRTSR